MPFSRDKPALLIFVYIYNISQFFEENNLLLWKQIHSFNPIALRKARIVYNFGLSECNRVENRLIWKGFMAQGNKQEDTEVVSPCKSGRKMWVHPHSHKYVKKENEMANSADPHQTAS